MSARDSGEGFPPGEHPDRLRWNARYAGGFVPSFTPHRLAVRALAMDLPDLSPDWCLAPGEPASLLPAGFTGLDQQDLPDRQGVMRRQLLARRQQARCR